MSVGTKIDLLSPQGKQQGVFVPEWDYPGTTGTLASNAAETTIKAAVAKTQHVVLPSSFHLAADNTALVTVRIYSDDGATETTHWQGYFPADGKAGDVLPMNETLYGVRAQALKIQVSGGGAAVRCNIHGASHVVNSMV